MITGAGAGATRVVFQRAFAHAHMKRTAKSFAGGTLSDAWKGLMPAGTVPPQLRFIANAFVNLQEARHEADYDLSRHISRREVADLIDLSEKAAEAWRDIRKSAEANVFLAALLVYDSVART